MIEFQTASLRHASEIAKLVNSAYRGDYSKNGWTTEANYLDGQRTDVEAIEELIQIQNNQIELAIETQSKKILGSVHLRKEFPETLYFGMLTIEPTFQNQGMGKKLIEHIEGVATLLGFKTVRFTVISLRNELIAFYERRGYVETGRFEDFPLHDSRYGIPKVSGLVLKEFQKDLTRRQ
jgi:ribosomal protein S18 acetylase RimI-like enzyme